MLWRQWPFNQQERNMLQVVEPIDGWLSNEVALLLYRLVARGPALVPIVEIGSWQGKSTLALAMAARDHQAKGGFRVVLAVDPHTGSQEHRGRGNIPVNTLPLFQSSLKKGGIESWVRPLICTSQEAARIVQAPIGGLFIDGSHEFQDVQMDFRLWFDKLQPGGWIAFHDCKWPGVREVLWSELYPSLEIGCIRRIEDTTFARKLRAPSILAGYWNRAALSYYQKRHRLKRFLRRRRKRRLPRTTSLP